MEDERLGLRRRKKKAVRAVLTAFKSLNDDSRAGMTVGVAGAAGAGAAENVSVMMKSRGKRRKRD